LIELATPEQIQGCLDLDGWDKDQLEVAELRPWLAALAEAGFEKLGEVWNRLDNELRALFLQKSVVVYDTSFGEEPDDANEAPIYATPDRFFMLELLGDDATQALTMRLIEDLYRADGAVARHAIQAARSEPPAELEEMAYRWRFGRLADLGYVDFYDALDLFKPLTADQIAIGEGTQDPLDDAPSALPLAIAEEVVGRSFLARAIGGIEDVGEASRLENALMVLVNRVLAAGRAKPGQPEVVRRGALYATSTLSLGLETVSRGDLVRARQALATVGLIRLFRVGYTVGAQLAKLALALAPRAVTAGTPARELVAGLCSPRPLFARAADQPPAAGMRPIESQADLRRAGELLTALTMRIALVEGLGVDLIAMAARPEPRPELDDHIRTAVARALLDASAHAGAIAPLAGHALSANELTTLRRTAFAEGALTATSRAQGRAAIRARLGASANAGVSAAILDVLIEGWLDDLGALLGSISDDTVDPRFVEGVLVDTARS